LTGRIFLKLILGVFCLLLMALVTVDLSAAKVARDAYIQNLVRQGTEKARMLALAFPDLERADAARVREMARAAGGRITLVRTDGKVLADSEANAAEMDNHRTRPELVQAFGGGVGWSIRRSVTIGIDFLYVAVPVAGGAIRIAAPLAEINGQVARIRRQILGSTALAFLPAIAIAALLARWMSHRFAATMAHATELAHGNFRTRLPETGGEFGQLARTLNETSGNLQQIVEQLEREHAEIEKVERIRKDFVINVSHELRTPLASIQGYTETLMDGALDDPAHNMRFLGIIRHNAERLARLTEDLLTLSRIEQRRQKFEFGWVRLDALLRDAIDSMRPMAEKKRIELAVEPGAEGCEAFCDSEAALQILSNLLDNAIKYTPDGGRISVGAHPAGDFFELFVRDNGMGIPEEDLPRLFERFYRVDKARSRELGGTGLGLAIVKHLVAAHNGSMRVESRVGQGTTFFFTLPAGEAASEQRVNPEFTAT
jgi:two-component system phosphate regulon sensor histidine kinase PhoR